MTTLKDFDITVKKGEFICIIGDVASGKSSVLSSLIGDLLFLESDFFNLFRKMEVNEYLRDRMLELSQDQV